MNRHTKLSDFSHNIQLVSVRRDSGGFRRVWGWLTDGDSSVVFWRHAAKSGFSFKMSDTYEGGRSIADKVDEKLEEHGYTEIPVTGAEARIILKRLLPSYVDVKYNDGFHVSTAAPRA